VAAAEDPVDHRRGCHLGSGSRPDAGQLYLTDIDQTGISRATIETHRQIQRAKLRASRISQVLAFDLDRDGVVMRDELVTALRKDAATQVRRARPAPASAAISRVPA
jgi:hypothetical protein